MNVEMTREELVMVINDLRSAANALHPLAMRVDEESPWRTAYLAESATRRALADRLATWTLEKVE